MNKPKIPTPHNKAQLGDIAPIVLMPGDPLRAKYIAETYLTNPKLVNEVRGMYAFTGEYQGTRVTVMGHGMGCPSIGIYSYELYAFYNVDTIIRIGSCGAYLEECKLGDIIIGKEAVGYSNFAEMMGVEVRDHQIAATPELVDLAINTANEINQPVHVGIINSSDVFYGCTNGTKIDNMIKNKQILAVEMEAYALYVNAKKLNKKALTILTVSDSLVTHEEMSADARQTGFTKMMQLALDIAKKQEGK